MSLTDGDVTITCDCGHKFTKRLRQLELNPRCACPQCGASITVDTKVLGAQLAQLRKSIADFNRR
jgi:predicted nucleic acid-binding Zn ribbon protein